MPPRDGEVQLAEIGERLRAYRMGRRLTPESLAEQIGISRAALYRAEKGQIAKIETLIRISGVLDVSLAGLLGTGVEYVDNALAFFERMRQLEAASEQIIGLFGPVSYLLTSDRYDGMLDEVLLDALPADTQAEAEARGAMRELSEILRQRKAQYQLRRPLLVSLIASADIERFLLHGAVARQDPADTVVEHRRRLAAREVRHIESLLREPSPGVQIGIVRSSVPATTFQIFRQRDRAVLAISPFRLGEQPNVSLGVGLITAAPEPMRLHEGIARRLWQDSLKGAAAADHVASLIDRHGIGNADSSQF